MKFLWITALLVFLASIMTFTIALIMQSPDAAIAIFLALMIIVISTTIRSVSVRIGRGRPLSELDMTDCDCIVLVQPRRMVRQLWVQLSSHNEENKKYWIKAYYSPNMHHLPGKGTIKSAHKRARVYVNGEPLLLYGKVHTHHPRMKNRQEMPLYANPLLHTAHVSRRFIIGAPFLLTAPIVGLVWYLLEQRWEDFIIACLIAIPIAFWWQGFTGNNPSSQEKEYQS